MAPSAKAHARRVMQNYPRSESWRLFIDGYRQAEGKWAFDSGKGAEKGFYNAMQGSWDRMVQTVDTKLTADEVLNIHDYCVGRGKGQQEVEGVVVDSDFRTDQADFGLVSTNDDPNLGNVTFEGAKEFIARQLSDNPPPVQMVYALQGKGPEEFTPDPSKSLDENAKDFIQKMDSSVGSGSRLIANGNARDYTEAYIKQYHKEIKAAKTDDEKLAAIAKCVSNIERLHPFHDGNCRTMVILTNKLLLQNGLSPTILNNPNQIDMFSNRELVGEIKKGQAVFQSYKTDAAIHAIEKLNVDQVNNGPMVNKIIQANLSSEPMQALAQLGKLYQGIKDGSIHLHEKKTGKSHFGSMFGIHKKKQNTNNTENLKLENVVLNQIQQLYEINIAKLNNGIEDVQSKVDELMEKKQGLEEKLQKAHDAINQAPDPTTRKQKVAEFQDISYDIAVVGRDLDRVQKKEQWYVDRLQEVKDEHKSLLTEHTSFEPNTLSSVLEKMEAKASRAEQPQPKQMKNS